MPVKCIRVPPLPRPPRVTVSQRRVRKSAVEDILIPLKREVRHTLDGIDVLT